MSGVGELYPPVEGENVPQGGPVPAAPMGERVREEYEDALVPDITDRDTPAALLSKDVESHAVVAVLLLVLAVCTDAVTALDTPNNAEEAASSLRVSSIVTILAVAAPAIRHEATSENQRLLVGSLLVFLALAGRHTGTLYTRTGDSIFCMCVLTASTKIYAQGGIEADDVRPDDAQNSPHRRQSIGALFGALLLYVGLRGVRAAFVASSEAADFKAYYTVYHSSLSSAGYAFSSFGVVAPLGGGHGILAATGTTVLLHNNARVVGSSAVAFEVAAAGVGAAVAALWALLGYSGQIDGLHAIFGPHACSSSRAVCGDAFDARRFASANNCTASLWLGALACCVFSFAIERRMRDAELTRAERLWRREGIGFSSAMAGAAAGALLEYGSTSGAQWHTDVCALLAVLGIFLSFMSNTIAGTAIYAGAQLYEESRLLQTYGSDAVFVHLTHCTLFVAIVLLGMHALGSILYEAMRTFFGRAWADWRAMESFLAVVATFGTSLSVGLYLASALLMACSNGSMPEDGDLLRDGSGKRTTIAFAMNHFFVVFAFLPLYACRCEVQRLNQCVRVVCWMLAVPVHAIFYYIALNFMRRGPPALDIVDGWPFALCSALAIACWATGAFV